MRARRWASVSASSAPGHWLRRRTLLLSSFLRRFITCSRWLEIEFSSSKTSSSREIISVIVVEEWLKVFAYKSCLLRLLLPDVVSRLKLIVVLMGHLATVKSKMPNSKIRFCGWVAKNNADARSDSCGAKSIGCRIGFRGMQRQDDFTYCQYISSIAIQEVVAKFKEQCTTRKSSTIITMQKASK